MKYLVCACAIGCAAAFCSIGMMVASATESGYAIGAQQ